MSSPLDFNRLLRLRLIVARHGEMDGARWWNTNGVLGRKGSLLMNRGFPKTHHFAQARLVFEVARARSAERFPMVPGCITLWNLPASIEDEFDAHWADWLDDGDSWAEFFDGLQSQDGDLLAALESTTYSIQTTSIRLAACAALRKVVPCPSPAFATSTMTPSHYWPPVSLEAKPLSQPSPTHGCRAGLDGIFTGRRCLLLHDHQGFDGRGDLRGHA